MIELRTERAHAEIPLSETSFPVKLDRPDWYPERIAVPRVLKSWDVDFPEYSPVEVSFQNEGKPNKGWDPVALTDVKHEFTSFTGVVRLDSEGRPLNPLGRTGLKGAGELWFWGANYAADPIVTRINPSTGKIEAILIRRKDTEDLAIPGGMVDATDMNISKTLTRELGEETSADLEMDSATILFRGVVNDRRNTDNRWIETTVAHRHLSAGEALKVSLKEGDDAKAVDWFELNPERVDSLYADHGHYLRLALENLRRTAGSEVSQNPVALQQLAEFGLD